MNSTDARGDPAQRPEAFSDTGNVPASCPVCHSPSIVTTSKRPDESSYWRCTHCGALTNH